MQEQLFIVCIFQCQLLLPPSGSRDLDDGSGGKNNANASLAYHERRLKEGWWSLLCYKQQSDKDDILLVLGLICSKSKCEGFCNLLIISDNCLTYLLYSIQSSQNM